MCLFRAKDKHDTLAQGVYHPLFSGAALGCRNDPDSQIRAISRACASVARLASLVSLAKTPSFSPD